MSASRDQDFLEATVFVLPALVVGIGVMFFLGASIQVMSITGAVTALVMGVGGWMLIEDEGDDDEW